MPEMCKWCLVSCLSSKESLVYPKKIDAGEDFERAQPSTKLYKLNKNNEKFPQAQEVENLGFFIGLHTKRIKNENLNKLVNILLKINIIWSNY